MIKINCDMGESFGIYSAGNDEEIMPLIDIANVACGFHASDPNHMRKTVELAKKHKVKVGAHPSFPDLQGFGRREMKMPKLDLKNMIMYQVGALKAFLDELDMPLNHIKPHGSLYVMASKDEEMARAIATEPDLLLLDEPFGGLNPAETDLLARSMRRLHRGGRFGKLHSEGPAMVIVEHKLTELMKIVDRVIVLNFGEVIAQGTPEEIARNKEVVKAYTGKVVLLDVS